MTLPHEFPVCVGVSYPVIVCTVPPQPNTIPTIIGNTVVDNGAILICVAPSCPLLLVVPALESGVSWT